MKIRLRDGSGTIELKFLVEDVDRYGKVRIYFRRKGQRKVPLKSQPGTPAFMAEYQAALTGEKPAPTPAARGTLRWLIIQYASSSTFRKLDDRTRRVRRAILDSICVERFDAEPPHGEKSFERMEARHVRMIRDVKAEFPEAANGRVKALRQVFKWATAEDVGHAKHNPAEKVAYLESNNPDGFHGWSEQEIRQFEDFHPVGSKGRLALDLFLYTGVRKSDVVRLGPQMERDGALHFTETKGRRRSPKHHEIPVHAELRRSINATPSGHLAYLVTEFGKPFTANGFGNWFHKQCIAAGLPGCAAHGLRKAGARRLAERGATAHQLMAFFGWMTLKEAERYTRQANRKKLTSEAAQLTGSLQNSEPVSNFARRSVQQEG